MEIIITPAITLSPVTATALSWQYLEGQTPVDFTSPLAGVVWTAEFLLENTGTVVFRTPAVLGADGSVSVTIPASVTAAIRQGRRIDAHYQIRFTAPLPDLSQVWRGPAIVIEVTP